MDSYYPKVYQGRQYNLLSIQQTLAEFKVALCILQSLKHQQRFFRIF